MLSRSDITHLFIVLFINNTEVTQGQKNEADKEPSCQIIVLTTMSKSIRRLMTKFSRKNELARNPVATELFLNEQSVLKSIAVHIYDLF